MVSGIYVSEHRRDSLPMQRMCGCDKSVRWNNYLSLETERPNCDLECHGPIAHGHAVASPVKARNLCLKLLDKGPVIAQLARFEYAVHAVQKTSLVSDVWTSDVQRVVKRWSRSVNRQIRFDLKTFHFIFCEAMAVI